MTEELSFGRCVLGYERDAGVGKVLQKGVCVAVDECAARMSMRMRMGEEEERNGARRG